jgi:hypothetical protein
MEHPSLSGDTGSGTRGGGSAMPGGVPEVSAGKHAADPSSQPAQAHAAPGLPDVARRQSATESCLAGVALRQKIDEWILPLRSVGQTRLDVEIGERLRRVAPLQLCLCVLTDHGCAGLEALAPRLHGTLPADLRRLYASLIVERDPLLTRATQEWCTLMGSIEEHCAWLRDHTRNADVIRAWLARVGAFGAAHLAVVPARGWLSRGAVFAFHEQRPRDAEVFALFYAAQRLAVTLELRERPYLAELLAMRFTARELDVLRAGLRGAPDDEIASRLGLSVDAIRYYFKKFKHRVPATIGHLKPRELARILHQMGKL